MAVEFKDYYSTLGVARDASDADIKKAFRRLAREYHPDVAKDKKNAEDRFKEINEAYDVLSDPAKRRRYDELGANWQAEAGAYSAGGDTTGWAGASRAGPRDFEFHFGGSTGFSDFFEQFFGGGNRRARRGGPGVFHDAEEFAAGGIRTNRPLRGEDVEGDILVTLDEVVHGATRPISLQRINPQTGQTETENFNARIPAGVRDGQTIRARGRGGAGRNGGPRGDLYLHVRVAAHPEFQVRDADLYHELELPPWDAVLGTSVTIPTLTSRVNLRVPPGTNNGQQLRVRGQGLPRGSSGERGDLYVIISIQLPSTLSAEERTLWEKLRDVSGSDSR